MSEEGYIYLKKGVITIKQKKVQNYVFKIHSETLRKSSWDLSLPITNTNPDIISLASSQILRFISEINGKDTEAQAKHLKREIKRLKALEQTTKTKKLISSLYTKLYNLQFQEDYLCLIIDRLSDYDRANKGFTVNGIKYRRFLGTTGGIKNSTIVYVSERIYPILYERLCCGRNMSKEFIPAKLEAYQALICSGSTPVSMPKGTIVVPDCIAHFKEDIIYVDDSTSEEPIVSFKQQEDIELTESDGYGIMYPSLASRWAEELGLSHLSGANLRGLPWTKGMVFLWMFYLLLKK